MHVIVLKLIAAVKAILIVVYCCHFFACRFSLRFLCVPLVSINARFYLNNQLPYHKTENNVEIEKICCFSWSFYL